MLVLEWQPEKIWEYLMNNNQLTSLPKEIGELTNLLYLEIGNNKLKVYPKKLNYWQTQELYWRNKINWNRKKQIKNLPNWNSFWQQ
jgi:Leucine-rich repeat (LRR) protein